jgi:hypothetical protein
MESMTRTISQTIIAQIQTKPMVWFALSPYNMVTTETGIRFHTKAKKTLCVTVELNGHDLYDITVQAKPARITGTYKLVDHFSDVYADVLPKILEDIDIKNCTW